MRVIALRVRQTMADYRLKRMRMKPAIGFHPAGRVGHDLRVISELQVTNRQLAALARHKIARIDAFMDGMKFVLKFRGKLVLLKGRRTNAVIALRQFQQQSRILGGDTQRVVSGDIIRRQKIRITVSCTIEPFEMSDNRGYRKNSSSGFVAV